MTMTRNSSTLVIRCHARVRMRFAACVAGTLALLLAAEAGAAACTARSGAQTAPLVELYTSEGCSSCPPADRWLSATFPADDPATSVVAIAFHVDYWDRLGWKDRFAQPAFTERQYDAMRANRAGFVFTPQVLLQGRDYDGWHGGARAPTLAARHAGLAQADIAIDAEPAPAAVKVRARARAPLRGAARPAALFVAYVDSGLVSRIKAGENAGKRVVHDHVVRTLAGPFPVNADGEARIEIELARPREAGDSPRIVAFVQDTAGGEVLQALALPCP
jgi:hypothetical protein